MMQTNASALVLPSPVPSTNATGDIRGNVAPIELPAGFEWLVWVLGAAALVLLGWLAWRYWRRRANAAPVAVPVPANARAKQALQQALALLSDPRLFCTAVSDALRRYLEEHLALPAPERTTEEFEHELHRTGVLSDGQKCRVQSLLENCDLAKFAKFEPTESELRSLWDEADRLIEETWIPPAPPLADSHFPPEVQTAATPPPTPTATSA